MPIPVRVSESSAVIPTHPNLRLKQHPDRNDAGVGVVALEPYGGAWLNSWLDRDLSGLSGRLAYRTATGVGTG